MKKNDYAKIAYNIKTGYSFGVYGCSAEYFTLIFDDHTVNHNGLYGSEYRVCEVLEKAGYNVRYIDTGSYGQLKGSVKRYSLDERKAIETITAFLNDNNE